MQRGCLAADPSNNGRNLLPRGLCTGLPKQVGLRLMSTKSVSPRARAWTLALLTVGLICSIVANGLIVVHFERALFVSRALAQTECPLRLEGLRGLIMNWAAGQDGHLPSDLKFISDGFRMTPEKWRMRLHPLLCPSGKELAAAGNCISPSSSDYIYVDYTKEFSRSQDLPGGYPLVYDRRCSNHGGAGIYIIRGDGLVIWDRDAHWLQQFARAHRALNIQLPEDIPHMQGSK